MGPRETPRGGRQASDLLRLVEERKDLAGQAFGSELWFRNHTAGTGARHLLGIPQLMAVGSVAERNEDGGATCCGHLRGGDGPRPADDRSGRGEALRHVGEKGHTLRWVLAASVGCAYGVIVTLAGLVDDTQFVFSRGQAIHGIDESAIDHQSALAAAA